MRKIAKISALFVIAGTLCGCNGNLPFTKKTPDFDGDLSLTAEITSGELEAKANVARTGNDWEFAFTEPKTLSGIILKLGENGVKGELGSLNFTVDENEKYALYPEIIAKSTATLTNVSSDNISSKDGVLTLETEFDGKKVTITADEQTGKLISLKCPYYKLSVSFSEAEAPPETSSPQ